MKKRVTAAGSLPNPTPRTLLFALQNQYSTRLHMFLIVASCVSVAILLTKGLLLLGFNEMWFRYLAALIAAYLTFFFGVYCWLLLSPYGIHLRRSHWDPSMPDFPLVSGPQGKSAAPDFSGGGGDFGGAGASGNWDMPDTSLSVDLPTDIPSSGILDSVGSAADVGDEGGCVLVIAAILLAALLAVVFGAAVFAIYQAPAILAEVVFEVLLGSPLARGARALHSANWPAVLLRKTWMPFAAMSATAMGFAMFSNWAFPQATTAGEVLMLILK